MAGKKNRYPTQRKLSVRNSTGVPQVNAVIDIARNMSQVNHRLYRSSRYYECSITIDADVGDGTTVDVYALMDTWTLQKSLQMAKSAWDKANAEAKDMLDGKVARWNDFRVRHGLTGAGGGTGFDTLTACGFNPNTLGLEDYLGGEFIDSSVIDQTGATRHFTWAHAPLAGEYSIVSEYDLSGNTSSDPTVPATGAYDGLLPNLSAGAAAALQEDGNLPPYSENSLNGNAVWVKVATLFFSAGRAKASTGFFVAPGGYIALTNTSLLTSPEIQIECKRGDYKGIHAPSMLE